MSPSPDLFLKGEEKTTTLTFTFGKGRTVSPSPNLSLKGEEKTTNQTSP